MANESDLDAGKMVKDVADQTGQVSRAPVASDGTITIPHNSAGLKSVDLADVDLLLTFSDSTFVIIPNGALEAISDAQHSVLFSDQKSSLADLFKMVGISNHAKSGSLRVVSGDLNAVKPVEVAAEPKQPEKELASSADLCLPEPLVAPAPMVKAPKVTSGSLAAIDQSDPLDPVAQHTMSHTPSYRSGTTSPELTPSIKFDPGITADNVINIAESQGSVLIAGRVAGSAKAGDTVTVTVNGVDSTTLVNSDKSFSVSVSGRDLVADTDHTIEARITTPAGNASDSARYGVDLVAPVAPVVALAHDTGASSSDGITKDGSLVVTVVESGAHAEYSTNGGNSWSSTFNAAEGINNVQVRQVDAAGNPGSSSSISFTLDTTPPAAPDVTLANDTGSSSSDHITKDGTLNLSGFENGATVEYSIDGGKNWSASFTPTEGANNVLVHQIDVAGNTSSAGSFNFTLDTTAPAAPGVTLANDTGASSSDHITNDSRLSLSGIENGATVEYSIDGGKNWSASFTPAEGANTVLIHQIDLAGNTSSAGSFSFTLDTTAPVAPGVTLANDTGSSSSDHITNDGRFTIGALEPGATVQYSTNGGSTWSSGFTAVEGDNSVSVRQIDVAGNVSNGSDFHFTLDTKAPATPLVTLTHDTANGADNSDLLTNNSAITVSPVAEPLTREYSVDGGAWVNSYRAPTADGSHTVQARDTDLAGNSATGSLTFNLDSTPPVAPGVTLAHDTGSSSTDNVSRIGELALNGIETGATAEYSTDNGKSWSSSFSAVEGVNNIAVHQIDMAGNVSSSTNLTFTLDTTSPANPVVALTHDTANGSDNSDHITSNASLTISTPSEVVTREYSVDGGGWVSSYSPALADGYHAVTVRDTDIAGNSSTGAISFTLDTAVPAAPGVALAHDTGTNSADNISRIGNLALSGIETGATVEYSIDNGKSWSSSFSAVEGVNHLSVHQIDMAGNVSSSTNLTFTLDTTAPTYPLVSLTHDTANGPDNSDHLSNNSALTVSPAAEPVAREYSVDGSSWSNSYTAPTVDGSHTVQVLDTDLAGNSSSSSLTFTLDTMVSAPSLALAADTGTSKTDHFTSNGSLVVDGVESGATVEYSIDGGNHWGTSFSAVEGANNVSVRQIDLAGNISSSNSLSFTLDTAAAVPTVSLTHDSGSSLSDFVTNDGSLTIGSLEPDATVQYSINGGSTWTSGFTAVEGDNTVSVRQIDVAGNVSNGTNFHFTLDTKAPATPLVTLTHDTANGADNSDLLTNNSAITVSPVAEPLTREYSVDGGLFVSNYTAPTADGSHAVQVRDTDLAGNSATGSITFTLDTAAAAPTVSLIHDSGSSQNDAVTNDGRLSIGSLEPGATVQYSTNGGSTWSSGFTAVEGDNSVSVRQIDVAGNVSNGTDFHFTLDTKAPATPLVTLTHDTANGSDNSDLLTNNSAITVSLAAEPLTREYSVDGGAWVNSYSASTADGSHTVQVRDTDLAGNSATGSTTFTLDTAAAAPMVSLTHDSGSSLSDFVTNDGRLSIGSLEHGATVQYSTNGGSTWTSGFTAVEGDNNVSVRQIDVAGNVSNGTDFHFTLDTKAPATPLVTLTHDTANGADNSDLLTNNSAITVSPVAEPLTREYSVDGGSWVNSYSAPTADGSHTVQVRDTDLAGNSATGNLTFNLDSTPPVAPGVVLANDTGSSSADNISSMGGLKLTGLESGAVVEYSINGGHDWSQNFNAVEGVNNLLVRQIDLAGNISSTAGLNFTLDTIAPTVPIISLAVDSTDGAPGHGTDLHTNNPAIVVTAANETVNREYSVDGSLWSNSYTPPTSEQSHTVLVRDTDVAGNSATGTLTFTLDTTPPVAPHVTLSIDSSDGLLNHGSDLVTNSAAISVTASTEPVVREYSVDGGFWSSNYSMPGNDGVHTVTVRDTDAAGNSSSGSLKFTLDTTVATPVVTLAVDSTDGALGHDSDLRTNNAAINVSLANETVSREYNVDNKGWSSSYNAPTADGSHTVQVQDTDVAGNKSNVGALSFVLDTTPPVPPSISLAVDTGVSNSDGLTSISAISVTAPQEAITREYSTDGSSWSKTYLPPSQDGLHTIQVHDLDAAGNTSGAGSLTFTLDTTPPVPTITLDHNIAGDGILSTTEANGNIWISGKVGLDARPGDLVTLTVNGVDSVGTVKSDKTFSISVNGNDLVMDTDHRVDASVSSVDAAGNVGRAYDAEGYTVDIPVPVPTITLDHNVAGDSIVNLAESQGPVAITGMAGGDAKSGDIVTLTVNGKDFTGLVQTDHSFSISVSGSDLVLDSDHLIDAGIKTSGAGQPGISSDHVSYGVDVSPPVPTIKLDSITADSIINSVEASGNVAVTGTVSGDALVGDTVTLTVNGKTYTDHVSVQNSFNFSISGNELINDPDHKVEVSISTADAAGNHGTAADSAAYAVDITPPVPTIDLSLSTVTSDNILNLAESHGSVTITGTVGGEAKAGDMVTLTLASGSFTANFNGVVQADNKSFSIDVLGNALATDADSKIEATVTSIDAAGNKGIASATLSYGVDITPPVPTISLEHNIAVDGVVNLAESKGTVAVTGTAGGDAVAGSTVVLTVNGVDFTGTVKSDGSFSVDVAGSNLAADHIIHASTTIVDTAGNPGTATDAVTYTVDVTPPNPTVTLDHNITGDGVVNVIDASSPVAVTGSVGGDAKPGDTVTLELNSINYSGTVDSNGKFSIIVPGSELVADTTHSIEASIATSVDAAGNLSLIGKDSVSYTVDTTPPSFDQALYTSPYFKVDMNGSHVVGAPVGSHDASPVGQATHDVIYGTSGNDTIDHNPAFSANPGQWSKTIHFTFTNLSEISSMEIIASPAVSGIPGFDLQGAGITHDSVNQNRWIITPTADSTHNGLDVNIVYDVTYNPEQVDFTATAHVIGSAGSLHQDLTNTLNFSWHEASTVTDFTQTTASGDPVMVLPSSGMGVFIYAGAGDDIIHAGASNDIIEGGAGKDFMDGGSGNNTATYEHSSIDIHVSLTDLASFNTGEAFGDTYLNIQNLTGSLHDDYLIGDSGVNILKGGAGNDILEGMGGADILDGGSGSNAASYEHSAASVTVSLADKSLNTGDARGDQFVSIQNLIGSTHDDILMGDSGDNTIKGGDGNDTLEGMGGNNILDGGSGSNTASYEHSTSGIHASLADHTFNTGDAVGDSYVNIQNLTGTSRADILIGDKYDNILSGGEGNDILEGMAGADTLDGGDGVNTASYEHASEGVTAVLYDSSKNFGTDAIGDKYLNIQNLTGSSHDDVLIGDSSSNNMKGGDGNDVLEGMAGADTLDGGAGVDTASYAHAVVGVTAALDPAFAELQTGSAYGDSFINIENLTGSNSADILIGNSGANYIFGGNGNDTLEGLGGADTLDGGTGINTASYEHATTGVVASLTTTFTDGVAVTQTGDAEGDTFINIRHLAGSTFNDTLIGDSNDNIINGLGGSDILEGMGGADTLIGSVDGNNTASYEHSTTGVTASLHNHSDNLGADAAGDTYTNIQNLTGSTHNDIFIGDSNANIFDGGAGIDTVSYDYDTKGVIVSLSAAFTSIESGEAKGDLFINVENLIGSSGNDLLFGDNGMNALYGGGGDDILEGLGGSDHLDGGGGKNTASYEHASASVIASLTTVFTDGSAVITAGDAAGDTYENIQNLTGSTHDDILIGDSGDNLISGLAGSDILEGMGGADTLIGSIEGNNTASYEHSISGVQVSLTDHSSNTGDAQGDTYINIQNLTGSTHDDILIGDSGNNIFNGMGGNDILEGMGGADKLIGVAGGNATASYEHSDAGVYVSLDANVAHGGHAEGDTFLNVQNLTGSTHDDILIGDIGRNILSGMGGNDILEGLGGADTLIGGLDGHATASYEHSLTGVTAALYDSNRNIGDDAVGDSYTNIHNLTGSSHDDMLIGDSYANIFNGGTGIDTVSYEYTSSGVTASLSATYTSLEAGEAQGDIFHNVENLIGSSHDDILIGDSGDNALYGGAGNDILEGMGGQNILDGGTGNNTASYEHSTLGVHASLSNYSFNTNDAAGDTYVLGTIQNLTGSTHDDILSGDGVANIFNGIGGSDQFEGLGGADTFMGSVDGSNTVTYEHASTAVTASLHDSSINNGIDASGDTYTNIQNLTGSSYNDILIGDSHANIFDGGAGIDTVSYDYASGVIVSLTTGLVTEAGEATGDIFHNVENLTGSAFNDIIIGDSGNNMLLGGDGNDILEGMGGINILDGGSGNNTVSYEHSILGVHASLSNHAFNTNDAAGDTYVSGTIQNLTGSTHNDILIGDTSANVLSGLGGNDIFEGLGGVDTLIGVAGGNATASYEHSLTGVTAALYDSASRNLGADAIGDKYINIQNLTGSAYADTLIGDSHANIFDGGAGIDTVSYDYASAGIKASLTAGLVTETGDATGDIFHNVENLTGSSFDDFLIGDSGINILRGGAGNDILEGMGGADIFDGGIGNNTASYEHANGAVICNLYQNKGYGGDALNDTYSNIQNLIGSRFADNLTGDNNDNIINGGLGDNVMVGLGGADTFIGGDDFDKVSYNSAFDIDAGNGVTVSLSSDYTYLETGDAKGDLFFGIEKVEGTTGDDYLIGDDNNNVFTGNSGDDVLEGLGGADELYGNGGNNTASYQHSHEGVTASLSSTPADNINTGDAAGDYYNNIQNLLGSNFDDTLVGDGQNNILTGGGGNDSIYLYNPQAPSQSVGNDTAYGGAANDTFYVSAVLSTDPLNLPTLIDGGSSLGGEVNTLVLQGLVSGSYNMHDLASVTLNVNTLNIKDTAATNLTISAADIQHMVNNGTASELVIKHDSGDTLTISLNSLGTGESYSTVTHTDHTDYIIHNAASAQIAQIHWQTG